MDNASFTLPRNLRLSQDSAAALTIDAQTGLLNRSHFLTAVEHHLGQADSVGEVSSLLRLDLDRFEHINACHGNALGDRLLARMARRLRTFLACDALLGRLDGDEFGIFLPGFDSAAAKSLAEALSEAIRSHEFGADDKGVRLTVSIGMAAARGSDVTVEALFARAGVALVQAKVDGRNRVRDSTHQITALPRLSQALGTGARIHRALEDGHFKLWAQPVVEVPSRKVVGYELLARLESEDGMASLDRLLPVAEGFGLAHEVDLHILPLAVRAAAQLQQVDPDCFVSVNLSPRSLTEDRVWKTLSRALSSEQIDPSTLVLEVREKPALRDLARPKAFLCAAKKMGVRIALDDFGAGDSSIVALRQLPIDVVKLDRSLLAIGDDALAEPYLRALVELISGLGIRVVAEGVENESMLAKLQGLGVGYAQGYLFGRPLPLRSVLEEPPGSELIAAAGAEADVLSWRPRVDGA